MKSTGTRTKRAAPIQKREKSRALMKEKRMVAMVKEVKSSRGVKERRSWIRRKDYLRGITLVNSQKCIYCRVRKGQSYRKERLLVRKRADTSIKLLSRIPADYTVRQSLDAGIDASGALLDGHFPFPS